MLNVAPYLMQPGQNYFVRTITDHWVGKCLALGNDFVVLDQAAWISFSGRLSIFVADGEAPNMEVEVVGGPLVVKWYAYLPWRHKLFDKTQ